MGAAEILGEIFVMFGLKSTLSDDIDKEWRAIDNFSSKASTIGSGLTMGLTVPITAAAGALGLMTNQAVTFEDNMSRVFTMLPGISETAMNDMSDNVLALSAKYGIFTDEIAPALYDALSAGISQDNVFTFMETASQASIGGVVDLNTVVKGLSQVVNAYGKDVITVQRASDVMFKAAAFGATTFEEMSQSLYKVNPVAAALGVRFEDVAGSLAAITMQGIPTTVAATQLERMFIELGDTTQQAGKKFQELSGTTFKQFIANGGTLQQALKLIEQDAAKTGQSFNAYFSSSEAAAAVTELVGKNSATTAKAIEDMNNAEGAAAAAYEQMGATAKQSLNEMKTSFAAVTTEIGNAFLPMLKDIVVPLLRDTVLPIFKEQIAPAIIAIGQAFADLPAPIQIGVVALLAVGAAIGPILMMIGPIATGIKALSGLQLIWAGTSWAALAPYLLIVGAIAAVILVLYALEKRYGVVSETVSYLTMVLGNLYDWLKVKVPDAINSLMGWINSLSDTTLLLIGPIGAAIVAWRHLDEIVEVAKWVYTNVTKWFFGIVSTVLNTVDSISKAVSSLGALFGINIPTLTLNADFTKARQQAASFFSYLTTPRTAEQTASLAESATGSLANWASYATGQANATNLLADINSALTESVNSNTSAIAANSTARKQTIDEMKLESDLIRSGSYNPSYTGTIYASAAAKQSSDARKVEVNQTVNVGSINNSGDVKRISYDFSKSVITAVGAKSSGSVRQ